MEKLLNEIIKFLEDNKRSHYYCEDTWYSCPKHPEGCADDRRGVACDCGSDDYNKEADALIEKIRHKLDDPKP